MGAEPTVVAVMLTANRNHLWPAAVRCWATQKPRVMLLVFDTSSVFTKDSPISVEESGAMVWDGNYPRGKADGKTIGELRNEANTVAVGRFGADILVHFDDDDYSHPNRIAEQVELLQSSGADVVGYNEMLFWREPLVITNASYKPGEAWLYRNTNRSYALGTSLCYWRKTWERKPFPATSYGEDLQFCTGLKVFGVPAFGCRGEALHDPRMIARIHAGNTSTAYKPESMAKASEWQRSPSWDGYCRSIMEAK